MDKAARVELGKIAGIGSIELLDGNVAANARMRSALNLPIKNIIAVASGKGGVGKSAVVGEPGDCAVRRPARRSACSTMTCSGPNVPLMVGFRFRVLLEDGHSGCRAVAQQNGKLIPEEKVGIKIFSIGFIILPRQCAGVARPDAAQRHPPVPVGCGMD